MDLRSDNAFWPIRDGLLHTYPPLAENLAVDVVVIGGGITGALIAWHLAEAGIETVVLDRRDIAKGSTSASTALLQYEVDTHLIDLIDMVGQSHAVRSYLLCLESILKLEALVQRLGIECGFERKKSLYVASHKRDVAILQKEQATRSAIGIDVVYLSPQEIEQRFPFKAHGALLSQVAAQVDPYCLAHGLLHAAAQLGTRVHDRTTITRYERESGGVTLHTDHGHQVHARRVIFATGYESQEFLGQQVAQFFNTYAFVSEPLQDLPGWGEDRCLIWETARPYFYTRTTSDGRVLAGGEDTTYRNDTLRDMRIPGKTKRLVKHFNKFFPAIPLEVAYSWAGTFGATKDGLAYIGATPEFPNGYFALGFGGNGITYSLVAAEILRDLVRGIPNPDAAIFRFNR